MKLKDQIKSSMVEYAVKANPRGKGNRKDYEKDIVMGGMRDASQLLQDRMRGKTDREPGPESPLTDYLKKRLKKHKR